MPVEIEHIELRSDTMTLPTSQMRMAMAGAEVGDDCFGEDPTVKQLEEMAADAMGKEDAVFLISGTMCNTSAIVAHCQRGADVLLDKTSHVVNYEAGSMSFTGGVMPRQIEGPKGVLSPELVAANIRGKEAYKRRTELVVLENSVNVAGGNVYELDALKGISDICRNEEIMIHMDGARIFNAAHAIGVKPPEITQYVDSVMFCLSKGLSAPVGSVLCGSREFIQEARNVRHVLGGRMRQAGVIAAPGIVALETMVERLKEDNANARRLSEGIAELEWTAIDLEVCRTNIATFDVIRPGLEIETVVNRLWENNIRCFNTGKKTIRMVVNRHVTAEDIDTVLEVMRDLPGVTS